MDDNWIQSHMPGIDYTVYYSLYRIVQIMNFGRVALIFVFNVQDELFYILWLGLNGLAAMALLQLGLQREKAGRVGILNNSLVIFTYIFQVSLTDDKGNG